jgi:hypothetical protein
MLRVELLAYFAYNYLSYHFMRRYNNLAMRILPSTLIKRSLLMLLVVLTSLAGCYPASGQSVSERPQAPAAQVYLPVVAKQCGGCYFLDSVSGSDANPGTSPGLAWRTLAPLELADLAPGSTVYFKRGSHWNGGLEIRDSGLPGRPILFTAYGDGERPTFTNPGNGTEWTSGVMIFADWVIVEGLLARDVHDAGVYIAQDSDYNIVRDMESTAAGIGISVLGQQNLVIGNEVHDLHMIKNTPGGGEDDYGAVGIWLGGSNNEISYNQITNCIAPSYDFGTDGGAVEWYGFADGNYVHHNWASGNKGFLEVGGGSARNTVVAYNLAIDNGRFAIIHLDQPFQSDVQNFRVENNTIVESGSGGPGWVVLGFGGVPGANTLILRNNIIYADHFQAVTNQPNFTHDHNLYYTGSGTELGLTLGQSEINANPLFVDQAGGNYHPAPNSPAIDQGIDLGYAQDFDNQPVFSGSAPDLGAYEYP